MSGTVKLHVGSVEEMGKRFIGAWHRLERGEAVSETHLTFFDLETMMATLSPRWARCLSRQLAETLSWPSSNHLMETWPGS